LPAQSVLKGCHATDHGLNEIFLQKSCMKVNYRTGEHTHCFWCCCWIHGGV